MRFKKYFLIVVFLALVTIIPSGFAADEPAWWRKNIEMSISTDSSSYKPGDLIRISGEVKEKLSGVPIVLQIINPDGILVKTVQLEVDYNKKYGTAILSEKTWKPAGTYVAKVTYGANSRTVETSFQITQTADVPLPSQPSYTDIIIQPGSSIKGCEQTNSCFLPAILKVSPGESVTWFNADTAAHTVTSGMPDRYAGRLFDRTMYNAGGTFTFTFEIIGNYSYHCSLHPWMKGIISVDNSEVESAVIEMPGVLKPQIPEWVKNNAKWWSNGEISESEFISAIQYLIEHQVLTMQKNSESSQITNEEVPEWVKNTTKWWSEDQISDAEFLQAIQFLIDKGIIRIG